MRLYFSPRACSMASRIAFYEAGAAVEYVEVDTRAKRTSDGRDFLRVTSLGLVPALQLDDGETLTENAAILQLIAQRYPDARLAPTDELGRSRLHQLLSFIGTELHKATYNPLLDSGASPPVKAYALSKAPARLAWLAAWLDGRDFLLDHFSIADAYLATVLSWSDATGVALAPWPALTAYLQRMRARPSVARALEEETALYLMRQARKGPPATAVTNGTNANGKVS